jgi:hypothetical protein
MLRSSPSRASGSALWPRPARNVRVGTESDKRAQKPGRSPRHASQRPPLACRRTGSAQRRPRSPTWREKGGWYQMPPMGLWSLRAVPAGQATGTAGGTGRLEARRRATMPPKLRALLVVPPGSPGWVGAVGCPGAWLPALCPGSWGLSPRPGLRAAVLSVAPGGWSVAAVLTPSCSALCPLPPWWVPRPAGLAGPGAWCAGPPPRRLSPVFGSPSSPWPLSPHRRECPGRTGHRWRSRTMTPYPGQCQLRWRVQDC